MSPRSVWNAFTASGRTAEENDVWNHVAKLGALRKQYEALRNGKSLDLLDEEQQLAYARVASEEPVLVVFNNDTKPANVSFDVSMIKQFPPNSPLTDALGKIGNTQLKNGKFNMTIPARTAGIFVREYVR